MSKILFVCTANICRSPMAEQFFLQQLINRGLENQHQVSSAGTWTKEGDPADPVVARILKNEYELSLQDHRSKEITQEIITDKDIILVMEKSHREALQAEFSEKHDQIFLLSEMVGQDYEIADPYRRSEKKYHIAVNQIDQIITYGFNEILKKAGRK